MRSLFVALSAFALLLTAALPAAAQPLTTPFGQAVIGVHRHSLITYPLPFQDDFTGTLGAQIAGRTAPTGQTWAGESYSGGANTGVWTLDGSGHVNGGGTSGQRGASWVDYTQTPVGLGEWHAMRWAGSSLTQPVSHSHLTIHATNSDGFKTFWQGSGNSGAITFQPFIANVGTTVTSAMQALNVTMLDGDTMGEIYRDDGSGNRVVDLYQNGLIVQQGFNAGAAGVAFTSKYGIGQAASFVNGSVDSMMVGDPGAQGLLWPFSPSRVVQLESNGDLIAHLQFTYSGQCPPSINYTLTDRSTNGAVTGYTDKAVSGLSCSGGVATALTDRIPAASLPASFYFYFTRGDQASGSKAGGWYSSVQKGGTVLMYQGQSLGVNHLTTGGNNTTTATQPADCWTVDGGTEFGAATTLAARASKCVTLTDQSTLGTRFRAEIAAQPLEIIKGTRGGTTCAQRAPGAGTGYYEFEAYAVVLAGRRVSGSIDNSGEYDVAALNEASFVSCVNATYDAYDAIAGTPITVYVSPIGTIQGALLGTDATVEAMRYMQWCLTQTGCASGGNPTRYKLLNYKADLQHLTSDAYHFTAASNEEQSKREIDALARALGLGTGRDGPSLASVVRVDDHTLDVLFNLNGATGLNITNAGDTTVIASPGDFRGGLRFAAASTFATLLKPISATPGSVVSGQQTMRYGFAGTPFTISAFVSGPWGSNPFNPENNTTVNNSLALHGVILQGLYAGEAAVAVQPYYQTNGQNYVSNVVLLLAVRRRRRKAVNDDHEGVCRVAA